MPVQSNSAQGQQRQAALYLRMSTDRQKYSIENQACALYAYAVEHQLKVVKQYCDEAKSGLTFERRPALRRLIEEVKAGNCGFNFILTYDVSRWGRFQDADESAYYEHLCRQRGVRVIYCAEGFDAYEGSISSVMKSLKRTLAAEYSRDLSQKVTDARIRLARAGLHVGGAPHFGLRRVVINKDDEVVGAIEDGYSRRNPGDRLVIRPGPEREQTVVRRIFLQFTEGRLSIRAIVRSLNENATERLDRHPWTFAMVRNLLIDERYIGNIVIRSFHQNGQIQRAKSPTQIIRHEAVFNPIVPAAHFHAAAERLSRMGKHLDDSVLLEKLKKTHAENGQLATRFLSGRYGSPSSATYIKHFGGLVNAYRAAGIEPTRNYAWIERKAANKCDRVEIMKIVASSLEAQGHSVALNYKKNILNVDDMWGMHIKLIRARNRGAGREFWTFSLVDDHRTDLLLLLRLNQDGSYMEDMYLVPTLSIRRKPSWLTMGRNSNLGTDMYRIPSISDISTMARRYLADVEHCMVHFGRTQQDIDKSYLVRFHSRSRHSVTHQVPENAPRSSISRNR